MVETTRPGSAEAEERAENLKERIYVTFTALAVVLALSSHPEETTPRAAGLTLLVTVLGTLLAVFTADFVSHLVVHAQLPSRTELGHMVRVSVGALTTVVLPLVFVVLAALEIWTLEVALRASAFTLVATLGVAGFLAVRRVPVSPGKKLAVLAAEVVLGALVVALELLVH